MANVSKVVVVLGKEGGDWLRVNQRICDFLAIGPMMAGPNAGPNWGAKRAVFGSLRAAQAAVQTAAADVRAIQQR